MRDFTSFSTTVFSPLLCSYGMSFFSRMSNSDVCVASRSIGYVGAPSSPSRPAFKYASLMASLHSAWLFPEPIGPENPLNRAVDR